MEHGAFTEGIALGGLTLDFEVKILICYILSEVKESMTFTEINYILQSEGAVNYFEYAKAISELLNMGNIRNENSGEGEQLYSLTPRGEATAKTLQKNIPFTIREKSVKLAKEHLLQKRLEKENTVQIKKAEDGYHLSLQITDIGSDLLNLTLFVPTQAECEEIKARFLQDPTKFYRGILAMLTADDQTVKSILSELDEANNEE